MDPIQTVLEAQARAERSVESFRADAARALGEARADAARLQARNSERTLRAIRRYEENCAARVQKEIDASHADARAIREQFLLAVEKNLDAVITAALTEIWPA